MRALFTDSRVKSRCPIGEVTRTGEDGDGVAAAIGIGEDARLIAYAIKRAGLGGYLEFRRGTRGGRSSMWPDLSAHYFAKVLAGCCGCCLVGPNGIEQTGDLPWRGGYRAFRVAHR